MTETKDQFDQWIKDNTDLGILCNEATNRYAGLKALEALCELADNPSVPAQEFAADVCEQIQGQVRSNMDLINFVHDEKVSKESAMESLRCDIECFEDRISEDWKQLYRIVDERQS